jgi:hypothetical protein
MNKLRRAILRNWNRLRGSIVRRKADADFAQELNSHIQLMVEEEMRRGLSQEDAYRQAKLQFGNLESVKERYRDQRGSLRIPRDR